MDYGDAPKARFRKRELREPDRSTAQRLAHAHGGEFSSPRSYIRMMNELSYGGRPVAWVDSQDVEFAGWIEELDPEDPLRRVVAAACEFLHDAERAGLEFPKPVPAALFYARTILMPLDEWLSRQGWSDEALAEHFNVPLVEAKWRRLDVAMVNLIDVGKPEG